MAPVGGLLALLLTGTNFSVSSGVGFLALFGVSVQTGVIMLEYINQLRVARPLDRRVGHRRRRAPPASHHDDHAGRDPGSAARRDLARHRLGFAAALRHRDRRRPDRAHCSSASSCCRPCTSGSRATTMSSQRRKRSLRTKFHHDEARSALLALHRASLPALQYAQNQPPPPPCRSPCSRQWIMRGEQSSCFRRSRTFSPSKRRRSRLVSGKPNFAFAGSNVTLPADGPSNPYTIASSSHACLSAAKSVAGVSTAPAPPPRRPMRSTTPRQADPRGAPGLHQLRYR